MDVDDHVFRDDFVFVFADVFGAQLHLACLDVVASLDERCVEHDSEHHFVRKASVLENDLNITLQGKTLFLLISQQEDNTWLFLAVELLRRVGELLSNVEASAAVHFKEGNTATT